VQNKNRDYHFQRSKFAFYQNNEKKTRRTLMDEKKVGKVTSHFFVRGKINRSKLEFSKLPASGYYFEVLRQQFCNAREADLELEIQECQE